MWVPLSESLSSRYWRCIRPCITQSVFMERSGCRIFATVIRFEDFELDCATAELYKAGSRLKLQDQPARLLCLLVTRAGTLVTRADIQETLWNEGQFVEFEHAINVAVKKIREVL